MSKSSKRGSKRTRQQAKDRSATTDVVTQLECAWRNPHAALIGAAIGGVVPWFARTLAHEEVPAAWAAGTKGLLALLIAVVLGCALFSALTVYRFGQAAFGDSKKALGFVLALEGVMIASSGATSSVALIALIAINAVANGSVIALARDATRKRAEADARGAATRARRRAEQHVQPAPAAAPAMEVEDRTVPAPRAARRTARPAAQPPVVWWPRGAVGDVEDAVIVSEQRFLA